MHWARWGDPDRRTDLPDNALDLIGAAFGGVEERHAVDLADVSIPEPSLDGDVHAGLTSAVGAEHVVTDRAVRIRHSRGKSTTDLLHLRGGDAADAPDAVVLPADHDEVVAVLALCAREHVAVVPFGGGTSVVGGLTARRDGFNGVVALDLSRLDHLVDVDDVSRTAVLGAGVRGPRAEELLGEHGYTLGHFPQSFEYATIGGFAATRSSGQSSSGYGRFDAMVVGLTVATAHGTMELGSAPATAAGPDLRELLLGSEGALGVITSVRLRVRPAPETKAYEMWRLPSFREGSAALRSLVQAGIAPTVLRLSDEAETAVNLSDPAELGSSAGGAVMLTGYEGTPERVARMRTEATEHLRALGATAEGEEGGQAWAHGRFAAPYLRDALLDVGLLVETFETATFWGDLEEVYTRARDAVESALRDQGTQPLVLCHISHVYETGASLYFTVAAKQREDTIDQWQRAKTAASDAITEAGATITHHHAVGRDHKPWLGAEIGELGVAVLRSVKATLDPEGVLNPGVLIP